MSEIQQDLFSPEEMRQAENRNFSQQEGPVTCLGMEFENDDARRAYFREELRKKLPELRKIEGFPIGEDDDIINLSDPPYYTACPNPWLNDFIAEWEKEKEQLEAEGKRQADFEVKEPYASDVSEGKNNPIYHLHTYHTKVPHTAIMRYLLHYTQPGDIILDGFAGTGMTGVAANECSFFNDKINKENSIWGRRHSILSDLSPAASFISYNLNSKYDIDAIKSSFLNKLKVIKEKFGWLYDTISPSGEKAKLNFVVWSEVLVCPHCGKDFLLWDAAADTVNGRMRSTFDCPNCGCNITKNDCDYLVSTLFDDSTNELEEKRTYKIALINYEFKGKRSFKKPDAFDYELVNRIEHQKINSWFPTNKMMEKGDSWGDTWRAGIHKGITRVHHFYTKRNLLFISALWNILDTKEKFIATSIISRNLTKLNRYVLKPRTPHGEVNGPLSGTLYVSSEFVEQNAFDLIESKIPSFGWNSQGQITSVCAAQSIPLANNTIDYIFTDPPFGDNIMYSELNFLWEAWLKVATDNTDEAIQNTTQGKDTECYLNLMSNCFKEYYRVLKPGRWITVEFSNTKASIWNAIQSSLRIAGFVIANVSALDKQHGGIKSMTYTTAVKEDLVITCYKPSDELTGKLILSNSKKDSVWDFLTEHLAHLPVHIERGNATTTVVERSPKILYDRLISYYVQHGYQIPMDAQEFQAGLRERFIERDGMYFTAPQAAEYEEKRKHTSDFVPMGLIVSDEANGIEWLKLQLKEPKTYQEISPEWMQAVNGLRKGDVLPELKDILEENFIEDETGHWHVPDLEKQIDLEKLKHKSLMKEFNLYKEMAQKPRARIKEVRVEAMREGFKQCFKDKDFATILLLGDKIPQNILTEDEVLLQYYDIAQMRS